MSILTQLITRQLFNVIVLFVTILHCIAQQGNLVLPNNVDEQARTAPPTISISFPGNRTIFGIGEVVSATITVQGQANSVYSLSIASNPAVLSFNPTQPANITPQGANPAMGTTLLQVTMPNTPSSMDGITISTNITAIDNVAQNPEPTSQVTIKVCTIQSFTLTGALHDYCAENVTNTICYVTPNHNTEYVKVVATLYPALNVNDLPAGFISWTGGSVGANQLERQVSKKITTNALFEIRNISAKCVTAMSNKAIHIHVVQSDTLPAGAVTVELKQVGNFAPLPPELGKFGLATATEAGGTLPSEKTILAGLKEREGYFWWHFKLKSLTMDYKIGVYQGGNYGGITYLNIPAQSSRPLFNYYTHVEGNQINVDNEDYYHSYNFLYGGNYTYQKYVGPPIGTLPFNDVIIGDLRPNTIGDNAFEKRPSQSHNICKDLNLAHEKYHRDDQLSYYKIKMNEFDEERIQQTYLRYSCSCEVTTDKIKAVSYCWKYPSGQGWNLLYYAKRLEAILAYKPDYEEEDNAAELRAYTFSNPLFLQRVNGITYSGGKLNPYQIDGT